MTGRTGRADTIFGVLATGVSVALLLFGVVLLGLGQHRVSQARDRLEQTLFTVAREQHRSPRDPALLPDVARRLPGNVDLEPAADFRQSGRVLLVWRRMSHDRGGVCLILPAQPGSRVTRCSVGG